MNGRMDVLLIPLGILSLFGIFLFSYLGVIVIGGMFYHFDIISQDTLNSETIMYISLGITVFILYKIFKGGPTIEEIKCSNRSDNNEKIEMLLKNKPSSIRESYEDGEEDDEDDGYSYRNRYKYEK